MKEASQAISGDGLNFDTIKLKEYEESTGVSLPEVQDQALMNVALVAPETVKDDLNWAVQQMAAVKPGDAVESMLAQQMIALNSLMMKSCNLALQSGQTVAGWDMHLKHVARLSNAFSNVSTALDKHRGKDSRPLL